MIYVSIDIETVGPNPLEHSMISFAAVACVESNSEHGYEIISEFSANLKEPDNFKRDRETMEFWKDFPEAWKAATENPRPPEKVMFEFAAWIRKLRNRSRIVFMAAPVGFDMLFLRSYFYMFYGDCPMGFSFIDLRSYAAGKLGVSFSKTGKKFYPKEWRPTHLPHTHIALDDAKEQAHIFFQAMRHQNE